MRRSFSEKREIIRIAEHSELEVNRTLAELGKKRSTFYGWYKRYLEEGEDGLHERKPKQRTFWLPTANPYSGVAEEFAVNVNSGNRTFAGYCCFYCG